MTLSIAVTPISNLPSIRLVSWKTELGVGVSFTSIPPLAKYPFSCAIQIGQLNPPGKTMTETGSRFCATTCPDTPARAISAKSGSVTITMMRHTAIILMTSPHYVFSPATPARLAKMILADLLSFVKTSFGHYGSHRQNAESRLVSKCSQIRELNGRDRVRSVPNPIWPGPGISGFPIRAVPGGRLCQATVNLTKGVPPISRNFLATSLWGRIWLDLAVILAEFQRAFSKREYGGSNPPAPANQSGLCVWSDRPTIIGPLPGFLHQPAVSGFPNRTMVLKFPREVSAGIRPYSQILEDASGD